MNGLSRRSRARPHMNRIAPALLALALPLALGACNDDEEPAEEPVTDSVPSADVEADAGNQPGVVGITLVNDTPAVNIPSVCGRKGARVAWRWADPATSIQSWRVLFKGGSPFANGDTLIESSPAGVDQPTGAPIDPGLPDDEVFSYVVQVVKSNGETVGRDPDIVIKDVRFVAAQGTCQDTAAGP